MCIRDRLKQLEILTEKIFAFVEQHPEVVRQIRQFLNFYLPTTIKLLQQYVVLQNQEMRMGNIDEGMQKIENMLENVIVAFQKQLDSLFESDVVDITADIQVDVYKRQRRRSPRGWGADSGSWIQALPWR